MDTNGLITADELSRMPGGNEFELVDGRLVRVNPNNWNHARLAVRIGARLLAFVEPRNLGTVMVAAGHTLRRNPDTVRGPDVSFVHRGRTEHLPNRGFFPGAPDLAVEVVSPDNTMPELLAKAAEYIAAGTAVVWIVDPDAQAACVITAEGATTVAEQGTLDAGATLPGFTLPLGELFDFGA